MYLSTIQIEDLFRRIVKSETDFDFRSNVHTRSSGAQNGSED